MKIIGLLAILITASSFGYEFGSNVPEKVKNQIVQDLKFMQDIQGSDTSGIHKEIFGELKGSNYVDWFEKRVTYIGLHTCGGGGASKPVACVIPFLGSSKIWLTKYYTESDHPQIAKMMVVFHEARHTAVENGNWSHATCPTPFKNAKGEDMKSIWTGATLAGEAACDVTPLGSYGSSMILVKNVNKFCSNCTEKVKMDAGIYADDQFGRIIDADAIAAVKADLYNGR